MTQTDDWPRAFGGPCCRGVIRTEPEDFVIDEVPQVVPDGSGEHLLLHVEKRGANTEWVAAQLAKHAGVARSDVSYAGMKDRHAVARQWFSVRLAGRPEPDWEALTSAEFRLLEHARHSRKLRPGTLRGNRFVIRVRGIEGSVDALDELLPLLRSRGVPNYFGEQRFGRNGANLAAARSMFARRGGRLSRHKRGLYLSAARAQIFNLLLAQRVREGSWEQALEGERLILNASRNSFLKAPDDEAIAQRLLALEIHPSGPLWGAGEPGCEGEAAALERRVAETCGDLSDGLAGASLKQERRALRAAVSDLSWSLSGDQLELAFFLPKGSFATALLREIVDSRTAG